MPQFTATVKSASGVNQTLRREAESSQALIRQIRAEGLVPVCIEAANQEKSRALPKILQRGGARKPSRRQMHAFMNSFATLMRSGMDLERCLGTLQREIKGPLRGVLARLLERVRGGDSLSLAMSKVDVFTPFQINIVRAGEYGGNLPYAVSRIATSLERELELQAKIRNAVAYPIFLVLFGLTSLAVMIFFVLPKFMKIYQEMKADLPLLTTLMLKLSAIMQTHGIWIVPLLVLGGFALSRQLLGYRENLWADRFRQRLPLIGRLIREVEVASFLRTLGLLIQSGIPVSQALEVVARVTGSAIFALAAAAMKKGVEAGGRLSQEMRKQAVFSESVLNLVAVGEESGRLDGLLLETSEGMEKRIDELVKGMLTFLEPLLVLVVGVIIGVIVMSMLLPIFSLSSALRRG